MDLEAYLDQQRRVIQKQADRVRDFAVFDFSYVPEQPVMRDEARELIDAILRFDVTGVPTHLAVIGSRGSGKTLVVKHLERLIPRRTKLSVQYANCRRHNTSYRILSHLLGQPHTGLSLSDLFSRFQRGAARNRQILVLDEIDLMSPKDKRRELLYLISRSETPVMVILLSNSPKVLDQLDAATRSSLQPVPMLFHHYNPDQLQRILDDRARQGLREWNDADLAEIAARTVRLANADARVAIKTLYYHVTRPEQGLAGCFDAARRDIVVDLVQDLADGNFMILWAAATTRDDLAKAIYRRYCGFARRQHETPFSYVHFYANLSYLQSLGLVALVATKQDRTYTNRVQLTFDPQVVSATAKLRFPDASNT